ncbi:MAG: tripartite tricarboxylate transporter substrate binding protein [Betaproteobacteria bacterium]|nr:tripartite tricarboxylate transporter substrate binding protein [Betaproteobacteria bacterium]
MVSAFRAVLAGAFAIVLFGAPPVLAQQARYPDRPLRLVVPWPPGGTVDVTARLTAPGVAATIGQQVVVDNRGGASGMIGASAVAQSKPDGYTLLINTIPHVTSMLMFSKPTYNAQNDFAYISNIAATPSFISVHPSVPVRTVKELIDLARARPGALNYAGAGVGSNLHISGELFNLLAKIDMPVIQYKGGGPALTAAISGEVSVAFAGVAGGAAFVRAGRLRALGVTSLKPVAALPGVPSVASVLPGYEFTAWFVVAAPRGTPPDILGVLNQHFNQAIRSRELVSRLEQEGIEALGTTPEEATTHIAAELKKYERLVRERKMQAN